MKRELWNFRAIALAEFMRQKLSFFLVLWLLLACNSSLFASRPPRTPLPTLTPTALFSRWTAEYVVQAIRQAGLEGEDSHLMTAEEYGSLPPLAAQAIRFSTPSICAQCGGMVLSFDQSPDMEATKLYYLNAASQDKPEGSAWIFVKDNVLLHLSGEIPRAQALQYGTALVNLK